MFTGIVQSLGKVLKIQISPLHAVILLSVPPKIKLKKGDSLSVNGVCLTAVDISKNRGSFDCMSETLKKTTLADLLEGDWVNLECPLTARDRLGGHLVQGHVDGVGKIKSIAERGKSRVFTIQTSKKIAKYLVKKGSVAVDGVSLTIMESRPDGFSVGVIPETLAATTLGRKKPGSKVNIEVDLISKLVEKFVSRRRRHRDV